MVNVAPFAPVLRGPAARVESRGSTARLARRLAALLRTGHEIDLRDAATAVPTAQNAGDAPAIGLATVPAQRKAGATARAPRRQARRTASSARPGKPGRPGRPGRSVTPDQAPITAIAPAQARFESVAPPPSRARGLRHSHVIASAARPGAKAS